MKRILIMHLLLLISVFWSITVAQQLKLPSVTEPEDDIELIRIPLPEIESEWGEGHIYQTKDWSWIDITDQDSLTSSVVIVDQTEKGEIDATDYNTPFGFSKTWLFVAGSILLVVLLFFIGWNRKVRHSSIE
ncbi:hypothetical protein [Sinomicrobium sp.]